MAATQFDWLDAATFVKPFEHKFPGGEERISAIYLVAPEVDDPVPAMTAFVDLAAQKHGSRRFVLLAGSTVERGGYLVGKLWQYLVDSGVEYCVLRPTWFNENFCEWQNLYTIKEQGKIYTACGNGKVPFVSATDIIAVAYCALVDPEPHNTDYGVLGPELLTYDEVAAKFSSGLGRDVVHVKLSKEDRVKQLLEMGVREHYAKFLTSLEAGTAGGMEERSNSVVEKVTGRPAQKSDAWVQQNKAVWQ